MVCVIMSPLGVMTAAATKMISSAYLKFRARNLHVTSFIFARKKMIVGI